MAEITNGMSAKQLTKNLLLRHNLLIKDLSGKIPAEKGQHIRLAVRSGEDNKKLLDVLHNYLDQCL